MAEAQGKAGPSGEGIRKYFFFIKEKVSSDWKDLAFHLDFRQSDIRNIAGCNQDDKSCCMDLLDEWLKRNGERATTEALMGALLESNLQSTADGLRNEYPELIDPYPALPVRLYLDHVEQPVAEEQTEHSNEDISKRISERILELEKEWFTPDVFKDRKLYKETQELLLEHKAFMSKLISPGSIIIHLTFLRRIDLDRFYFDRFRIGEGTLSQALTHILLPEEIQREFAGVQLIVRLKVSHGDLMSVSDRLEEVVGKAEEKRPIPRERRKPSEPPWSSEPPRTPEPPRLPSVPSPSRPSVPSPSRPSVPSPRWHGSVPSTVQPPGSSKPARSPESRQPSDEEP